MRTIRRRASDIVNRVGEIVPKLVEGKNHAVNVVHDSGRRLEDAIREAAVIQQIQQVSDCDCPKQLLLK